jgi:hypothetical protein
MAAKGNNSSKTILITLAAIATIGLLCCGGAWVLWIGPAYQRYVEPAMELGKSMAAMAQALPTEMGAPTQFQPFQRSNQDIVLLFGVPADVELTPAKVTELQDAAWKAYAESFATSGGIPFVSSLAVGHSKGTAQNPIVGDWDDYEISLEEVSQRTGIAVPPPSEFTQFIESLEQAPGVKITIDNEPDDQPEDEPEEGSTESGR